MEQSELEQILSRAGGAGEAEFTVDFYRAARLMAHRALPEPTLYLVKLVQAALAQGASRLEIQAGGNRLTLAWNGPALTRAELEELSRHLLWTDPQRRYLHHLAVGLNTLYSLDPAAVRLSSPQAQYLVSEGRAQLEEGQDDPTGWEVNRLEILRSPEGQRHARVLRKLKKLDLGGATQEARGLTAAELRALQERCRWAPIPILLNGRPLNNPHWNPCPGAKSDWTGSVEFSGLPHGHSAEAFLYLDETSNQVLAAPPDLRSGRQRALLLRWSDGQLGKAPLESDGSEGAARLAGLRFAGQPALAGFAALARGEDSWSRLGFVHDGILLGEERNLLDRPGVIGVVSTLGLTIDLSEFGVVHNQAFQRTMELLREQVRWLDAQA